MNLIDLRYIDNLAGLDLDTVDISKSAPEFEPNRQFYFMAKARSYVKKKSEELGRPITFFTHTIGHPKVVTLQVSFLPFSCSMFRISFFSFSQ